MKVLKIWRDSSRVPTRKNAVGIATRILSSICLVKLTTLMLRTLMTRKTIQITKLGIAMTYQLSLNTKKISRLGQLAAR